MSLSNRGQMTVEIILIAVIVTGLALMIGKYFKANELIPDLIQGPWKNRFAGMIENGVWGSAEGTQNFHPNLLKRHSSLKGDAAQ